MSRKNSTNSLAPDITDKNPVIQTIESHPRNPRIHRPLNDIQTDNNDSDGEQHSAIHDAVSGKLGALKRTAYHMLSKTGHPSHQKQRTTTTPAKEDLISGPGVENAGHQTGSMIDTNPYHHPASNPKRRFTSMPHPLPSSAISDDSYVELATHRIGVGPGGSNSPPIVDFTRFEDTYRGPRNGTFEGLLAKNTSGWKGQGSVITSKFQKEKGSRMSSSNSTKKNRRSSRGSQLRHGSTTSVTMRNTPSSLSTGLSRDEFVSTVAPQSASSRKPDPRSILVALREVEADDVARGLTSPRPKSVESYFSTRELLEMHFLDQVDFEEREMVRQKLVLTGNLEVEGRKGDLVVMGETIRRASIYSSSTMILGGREHELPIIVISCIEELYRTGIYQPNLFRALPNRTRLMELISIFDSEKQPPGSIIRDRSRPRASRHISTSAHGNGTLKSSSNQHTAGDRDLSGAKEMRINVGFGAATSLHLESMPDICALLSTYISSLPEPVLPPFLFRAFWELCGIEEDEVVKLNSESEAGHHSNASPASVTSTPIMRTYTSTSTSPLASSRILTAQLLLHLLPSPNFSLLVYFLAFFSQAALVREENGVGIEDLAKMFGGKIFGGGLMATGANNVAGAPAPTSTEVDELQFNTAHNARRPSDASSVSNISASSVPPRRPSITTGVIPTPETRREGEVMMCWFLRRWGPISDGLFEVLSGLGIDDEELSSEDDKALDQLCSKTSAEGVKEKSRRTWSRNPSTSTRSSSSCYSSSPSSPKTTPTLPKFLRRDTFGRIPLPQDWLDRLSSASRPISRSLSLTRSRSRSLSQSLSLSRSRSRSASPPLDPPDMQCSATNETEVDESGIVHARPQGRTRFQLGTGESGTTAGRKRAASALPYTDSPSRSSARKLWIRDGLSRNRERVVEGDETGKRNTEKRSSKEPPKHLVIPVPVHADVSVPMSVQMLEEMDIVDDYVMLSLESPSSPSEGRGERLQAPAPMPPRVDARLLDSFLRTELALSNTSPLSSPFNEIGPISPFSESSPPIPKADDTTSKPRTTSNPTSPSLTIPPPPVNSLSTSPYRSPPLPMNPNTTTGLDLRSEEKPRRPSTSDYLTAGLPKVHLTPPTPLSTSPPTASAPSPATPPTTSHPHPHPDRHSSHSTNPTPTTQPTGIAPSSPSSPTPTRLRTTIHLVLLQNQLKRRTEALRRALTSSSKHFLRSSYLEQRVRELEVWIEKHSEECGMSAGGGGGGGGSGGSVAGKSGGGNAFIAVNKAGEGAAAAGHQVPEILRVDAYGRPRERGDSKSGYTRAVRPIDLKAMHHHQSQRSKSAGYDGGAGHGMGRK